MCIISVLARNQQSLYIFCFPSSRQFAGLKELGGELKAFSQNCAPIPDSGAIQWSLESVKQCWDRKFSTWGLRGPCPAYSCRIRGLETGTEAGA